MRNRLIAVAAALLFGVSTPAFAQGTCYNETVAAMKVAGAANNLDMTPAFVGGQIKTGGESALTNLTSHLTVSPACKSHTAANVKAYAGLGQPSEPAPQPAATSAPNTLATAVSVGPGEQIDNRLEAVEARDGIGNTAAAEAAARRAEAAADRAETARRERDSAATKLQQIVARPGATPAQINAATKKLQEAEKKLQAANTKAEEAKEYAEAAKVSAAASAKSAKESATAAAKAATAQTEAGKSATAAVKSAAWLETNKWMIWAALALAAIALLVGVIAWFRGSRKQTVAPAANDVNVTLVVPNVVTQEDLAGKLIGFAKQAEVDELKADLAETNRQVGKKDIVIEPGLVDRMLAMEENGTHETNVQADGVNHIVGLRKGAGTDVYVSNVKGHTVSNTVNATRLIDMLSNAAWSGRLTKKADG